MKIILCRSQFVGPISGAEETTVTYALELKKSGYDPSVLLMFSHPTQSQYIVPLRNAGVSVTHIASHRRLTTLNFFKFLARHVLRAELSPQLRLRKYSEHAGHLIANRYFEECRDFFIRTGADIVHVLSSDLAAPVMISAAHATGVPVLFQETGTPFFPLAHKPSHERLAEKIPLCSRVAALSPRLVRLCDEKYGHYQQAALLPIMSRDLKSHSQPPKAQSDLVRFGFAARIEALKGIHVLIDAFAASFAEHPNIRLDIIGSGRQSDSVAKQAKLLDIESILQVCDPYTTENEKRDALGSLDVLVHPSFSEGTPNCIAEAMSLGLPVIATNVGGVSDVVTPDTGILVPPGDHKALSEAMNRLITDHQLRSRMGVAARARYEQLFQPSVVMPLMLDLYQRIIADAPAAPTTQAIRAQS